MKHRLACDDSHVHHSMKKNNPLDLLSIILYCLTPSHLSAAAFATTAKTLCDKTLKTKYILVG